MNGGNLWLIFIIYLVSPVSLLVSIPIKFEKFPNAGNYLKFKYHNLEFPSDIIETTENMIAMNITLGTPSQEFLVIIDTGSPLLYVMGENSSSGSVHKFNPDKSSSFIDLEQEYKITYVSGSTEGFIGEDIFGVNGEKGKIHFLVARKSTFTVRGTDGILGLAQKYKGNSIISLMTDEFSFLAQMIKKKEISKNIFSIDLLSQKIHFGEKHNDFEKDNVSNCMLRDKEKPYWSCRLSYITFKEDIENGFKEAKKMYVETVIDSGSNVSLFSYKYQNIFLEIFGKQECIAMSFYIICQSIKKVKDIYFVFNGKALRMKKENIFKYSEPYGYVALILFLPSDLNLLGINFMTDYHVLFDKESEKIMFYSDESNKIYDVSKYTTDKDFIFSDYLTWFIVGGIMVVVCGIIIGVLIYVCKKRNLEKEVYNNISANTRLI